MTTRVLRLAMLFTLIPGLAAAQATFSSVERRITTATSDEFDPHIAGGKVVYTVSQASGTDVWYFDLTTNAEFPVTTALGNQELSDVSGDRVAYTDLTTTDVVVFSIADQTFSNLTSNAAGMAMNPSISGALVAWEDRRDGNLEIYARDLSTGEERRVTTAPETDSRPAVSGTTIVWDRCLAGSCDVWAYDWLTGLSWKILESPTSERRADVDGDRVAYEVMRDGDQDICVFDLLKQVETCLQQPGVQGRPTLSGDVVAFEQLVDGAYHIALWHLPSGQSFQATQGPGTQFLNDIDDGRVVYTDDRNGHLDIYMLEFTIDFGHHFSCADPGDVAPTFETTLLREKGTPQEIELPFAAAGRIALVCIDNGFDGATAVSSGRLWLNDEILLAPAQWKDEFDVPLTLIERARPLAVDNRLRARLTSEPGSAVRVRVYEATAEVAARLEAMTPEEKAEAGLSCSQGAGATPFALLGFALLGLLAWAARPMPLRVRGSRRHGG